MNGLVGSKNTISNVAARLKLLDTGGHETNNAGQREDDPRGLRATQKSG
jgi:hypothetical protein